MTEVTIEFVILKNLLFNDRYMRAVFPFLKEEYFTTETDLWVFKRTKDYIEKYNSLPTGESLFVDLEADRSLNEMKHKLLIDYVSRLSKEVTALPPSFEWLVSETEKFCKNKALYNAMTESVSIMDDKSKRKDSIPSILQKALAVSFDNHIGHDYLEDVERRFDYLHHDENRIPFDLEYFNKITNGGLKRKTLNVFLAGTNVGKSLVMCHFASSHLSMGRNVLYITLEMSEEEIAFRIDANLLDQDLDSLIEMPRETYIRRLDAIQRKTVGKLIIHEFPTGQCNANHFRHLVEECKLKKNFFPDVVYIDYINLASSCRIRGGDANSYFLVKAIAEELRGLAVELGVPIITATQTTRSGFQSSDVDLTDTAESFGLPATSDLMLALIRTEDFDKMNQILVKQLKNRYSDAVKNKKFVIGVDRPKMKLYDVTNTNTNTGAGDGGSSPKPNDPPDNPPKTSRFEGFQIDDGS